MSIGAAAAVGAYSWRVEPYWLEIVPRSLPVRSLPKSLVGCTLVQFSDIHVGSRVSDDFLLDTFRRVAALRPDIVVITGDLMSLHGPHDPVAGRETVRDSVFPWRDSVLPWPKLAAVYRHFPKGRLATVATLGNHDYGPRWSTPEIAQQVVEIVQACGITVLRNQTLDVDGLQIIGLDDLWAKRFEPHDVLARLDTDRAAIVLSHNPDTADLPVWRSFEGWILAGHTHGGQCKPPFLPPPVLPVQNRRYTAGEFNLPGNRHLYINRGVGHLLQVRFNVRPEVTVFKLRRA
jgi:predicted MPP superfamily phosphohydrolase